MPLRLQGGGAYTSDIRTLRSQIRANGTLANIAAIPISHPLSPGITINLHINLAYQANSNLPPINGSLYAVAFGNPNGIWHFNVGAIGAALPGVEFPGGLNGSYASLGFPDDLPAINNSNLGQAVMDISNYMGGAVATSVLQGMTRIIIAVNESIRFDKVETEVNAILGNGMSYTPPIDIIRAWGGHILGS